VEKTVVQKRKDAGAGARVTKARNKEAGSTAEAIWKEEKNNQKNRGCHEKIRCCRIDGCSGVDLLLQ